MDKFYIITNRDKDQNLRFTEEIVQYLKEHGIEPYSEVKLTEEAYDDMFDWEE